MSINRRDFIKGAALGGVAATGTAVAGTVIAPSPAQAARAPKEVSPDAIGMLYDSTLCIGCKACVAACKETNNNPAVIEDGQGNWNDGIWDSPKDLSAKTFNIIKAYQHGTMAVKDREENGHAFVKRHCLHCVDPSCVSVCPVSAMQKDAKTGVVSYNPDACIGCRYCVFSCPFSIPKFDYNSPTPKIGKCEFCRHLLAEDQLPACCDVCPTGASLFGPVKNLDIEAKRRLDAKPGEAMVFPRGDVTGNLGGKRRPHEAPVATYQRDLYGDTEGGGTQVKYLAGVPFEKLDLPGNLPDYSYASVSEGIQHTLYKGLLAPIALLAGLSYFAKRSTKRKDKEGLD